MRRLAEALQSDSMRRLGSSVHAVTDGVKNSEGSELWLGYRLSYPDERIVKIDCSKRDFGENHSDISGVINELPEGLYTAFIHNPAPERKPAKTPYVTKDTQTSSDLLEKLDKAT